MPIFEYQCSDCEQEFEAFVTADRTAECPACQGANLRKLFSSPGMVGGINASGRNTPVSMSGGCGAGGAHCACRGEA